MSGLRSKTFLADWFRKHLPTREQMAHNKYLRPLGQSFLSPELWRFTRRSVPRGVALGLFAAFIVPLGQIFLAALLAFPARANVPLAAAVTFVTNPFTFPFWLLVANKVGATVLNIDAAVVNKAASEIVDDRGALAGFFQLAGLTAFGFVILAVVGATSGYLIASFIWRNLVIRRRKKRLDAMVGAIDRSNEEDE